MTQSSTDGLRSELGFALEVRRHFQFLEDLGFRVIEGSATQVRYMRREFAVEIYHGRQSYEIGLNLVRHDSVYSLEKLLEVHKRAGGTISFQPFAATDRHGVAEGVGRLARMFASCSSYFLTGSSAIFQALDEYGKDASATLAADTLAYQLRPMAEAAFRNKDYKRAADLYDRMRERLTPAEIAKLNFAKSRS